MNTGPTPLEQLLRELAPQVLGPVVRRCHDFAAAEDAVQEALIAAATQWPKGGTPENPRAWLIRVALRRSIDQQRSEVARRQREALLVCDSPGGTSGQVSPTTEQDDDTLSLFFMCCHPSLTTSSAIALTLRAIGGLTTAEIASAFFVPEATMAQRISRAKQSIRSSSVPFQAPDSQNRTHQLRPVMHILYLIFNEGYTASTGPELHRVELSNEAIRLTRSLQEILPDDPEVTGLLALMLLTDARRAARTGPDGELIPLPEQDRTLWNRTRIAEGIPLLNAALAQGMVGYYQIQAAIAALHDEALKTEDTDWPQIVVLYDLLKRISDNPMASLNRAIAVAMVHGARRGLQLLAELDSDPRVARHYRLKAVRAHLLEMDGDHKNAEEQYRLAAQQTTSIPERDYLLRKAARLASSERRH